MATPKKSSRASRAKTSAPRSTPGVKAQSVNPTPPPKPRSTTPVERWTFIRDEAGNPVGCVAYRLVSNGNSTSIAYGLSCHNPRDNFNRTTCRDVARGRLRSCLETYQDLSKITVANSSNFADMNSRNVKFTHLKFTQMNARNQPILISGFYHTEEKVGAQALADLFASLEGENQVVNRIRKLMPLMAQRTQYSLDSQNKESKQTEKKSAKKSASA